MYAYLITRLEKKTHTVKSDEIELTYTRDIMQHYRVEFVYDYITTGDDDAVDEH